MEFKSLTKWIIADNTFYPLGIKTIGDSRKAVILCWGFDKVITFIIKSIEETLRNDSEPGKTYILLTEKSIKQIIATEYNVICYDDIGDVNYFSTYKSLDQLNQLKGVKYMSPCKNGFILIRHGDLNTVFLEIYPDTLNQSEVALKSYDLSWEQLRLYTSRSDEDYCINAIGYDGNLSEDLFFKKLLNLDDDFEGLGKEVLLFSVDNYLYWLKLDIKEDEHFIVPLKCCSSTINKIWYSKQRKVIFLLLKSGVVDCIYYSEIFKFIRHTTICLGENIICSEFIDDEIFVYSNGLRFFQTKIEYNEIKQDFEMKNLKSTGIEGVSCISYLKYLKKILCLTENRIFYQISLLDTNKENEMDFIEIKSVEISNDFEIEKKLNEKLRDELRCELINFEKFSIYQNRKVIQENCSVEIFFHKNVPNLDFELVYYPKEKINFQKSSLFILIKIEIREDVKKLLQSGNWFVLINSEKNSGKKILRKIKLTEENFKNTLQILEVFNLEQQFRLPTIKIELCSTVTSNDEALLLKINLTNIKTNGIKNLIQLSLDQPFLGTRESSIEKTVRELNQQYLSNGSIDELKFCSYDVMFNGNFDEIVKLFDEINLIVLPETFYIVLLNYCVKVCFDGLTKMLRIESDDAGALYSVKLFILNGLDGNLNGSENRMEEEVLKTLNVRFYDLI